MNERIRHLFRYITYFIRSRYRNGHGIHPPFLYDFTTKVIFRKEDKCVFKPIDDYLRLLKSSDEIVIKQDYGAGSHIHSAKSFKISSVARISSTTRKYGRLLSGIVKYYNPETIIELGTSLGVGTSYLALNMMPESRLYTIEGSVYLSQFAELNCKLLKNKQVQFIHGNFDEELPHLLNQIDLVDLVFIDGNHCKEPTLRYFECLLPKIHDKSVFIFDDIHWSEDMESAWDIIKSNPSVKLSVDLFQFGLLFFKKELTKQDYIIRF